jgi:hypothetical protein
VANVAFVVPARSRTPPTLALFGVTHERVANHGQAGPERNRAYSCDQRDVHLLRKRCLCLSRRPFPRHGFSVGSGGALFYWSSRHRSGPQIRKRLTIIFFFKQGRVRGGSGQPDLIPFDGRD